MKKVSDDTGNPEWDESILKMMGEVNVDEIQHYKFRAECEQDVLKLRMGLGQKCLKLVKTIKYFFPDTDVDLYTTTDLDEIKNEIRKIKDGHVMLQTIELAENYTGERNFEMV